VRLDPDGVPMGMLVQRLAVLCHPVVSRSSRIAPELYLRHGRAHCPVFRKSCQGKKTRRRRGVVVVAGVYGAVPNS
jgi:hypothetical protein